MEAFAANLVRASERLRAPELFRPRRDALYLLRERHGIAAAAIPTSGLTPEELVKLLTFRLGQYLAAGFVDARVASEARMTHEPLSEVCDDDVHVVAGSATDGEILGYIALRAIRPSLRTVLSASCPLRTPTAGSRR